jgi:hypothetical protein
MRPEGASANSNHLPDGTSGMGRIGQMATAGNPTAASSLKVAMVSSVM